MATVLHPPVAPVFFSFRVMVGMGLLMLLVSWAGVALMLRRRAGVDGLPKALSLWRGGDDLRRVDRDAGGLVHDRDRAAALAGDRAC